MRDIHMSKEEMMQEIEERLRHLPEAEKQRLRASYAQLFQQAAERGMSEDEITEWLRRPAKMEQGSPTDSVVTPFLRSIIAFISLSLFNIIFILGPFIAISSVLLSLWLVSFVLVVCPVGFLIQVYWSAQPLDLPLFLSAGAVLTGTGLLLGVAMYYLSKWYGLGVYHYTRLNLRWIRGE
jgi:uncharacterized membrane protein